MKVRIVNISSLIDAMRSMYMSKRTYNNKIELTLFMDSLNFISEIGGIRKKIREEDEGQFVDFEKSLNTLFRIGQKHTTLLRFIDITVVVTGLHRGAVDDFDSHAKRLENRIVRSSTRLADYQTEEMSNWYADKIIPTDLALEYLEIKTPEEITYEGETYVRAQNGYIKKGMENDRDVKRGLYMLSLPMDFTFKVNLVELAHIYRERGKAEYGANGKAAPELQEMMEMLMDELTEQLPMVTREYLLGIRN